MDFNASRLPESSCFNQIAGSLQEGTRPLHDAERTLCRSFGISSKRLPVAEQSLDEQSGAISAPGGTLGPGAGPGWQNERFGLVLHSWSGASTGAPSGPGPGDEGGVSPPEKR